jgi:hypothetical protein
MNGWMRVGPLNTIAHGRSQHTKLTCPYAGYSKTFPWNDNLQRHIQTHRLQIRFLRMAPYPSHSVWYTCFYFLVFAELIAPCPKRFP